MSELKEVRIDGVLYVPVEDSQYVEGDVGAMINVEKSGEPWVAAIELKNVKSNGFYESLAGKRVRVLVMKRQNE